MTLTKRESVCQPITPYGKSLGKMVSTALALLGSMIAPFVASWMPTVVTWVRVISTVSESSATLSARIVKVIVDRAWPSENVIWGCRGRKKKKRQTSQCCRTKVFIHFNSINKNKILIKHRKRSMRYRRDRQHKESLWENGYVVKYFETKIRKQKMNSHSES